ncbi:sulfurtransferase complex subunit TusD [Thalassotalea mangrovi]|uniref:sulfurtransferase complex subunit TusD n=1 Tax=Thalassotalea mangrovi TaxID=2572245 RepID=UPI00145FB7F4|nr:sulfurtransferase complex subunit TusD [Thalassotalea mangrovi]
MTTFAIIISTAPTDNRTLTALKYAKAILAQGHQINGVFFYQHGVINANSYLQTPSDEINHLTAWDEFHKSTNTPMHLCISAAERRGLTDSNSPGYSHNIASHFTISGLGELVVLTDKADKVVQL